ncbi:MAG: hypothetical protein ACOH2H_08715 [Cypionkella sp.]
MNVFARFETLSAEKRTTRHLGWFAVALIGGLGLGAGTGMAEGRSSGSSGGLSLNLGGLASVSIGSGSLAGVDANVGGIGASASVLGNDSVAGACVGSCGSTTSGTGGIGVTVGGTTGSGTTGTGTGGTGTPVPGVGDPTGPTSVALNSGAKPFVPVGKMRCAGDGNTAVYNGYTVVDRSGVFVGWVNDTQLDPNLKITKMRLETPNHSCVGLTGGSYKVFGRQVSVNIDATSLN